MQVKLVLFSLLFPVWQAMPYPEVGRNVPLVCRDYGFLMISHENVSGWGSGLLLPGGHVSFCTDLQ